MHNIKPAAQSPLHRCATPLADPSLDELSCMSRLAWIMKDGRIADLAKTAAQCPEQ